MTALSNLLFTPMWNLFEVLFLVAAIQLIIILWQLGNENCTWPLKKLWKEQRAIPRENVFIEKPK
jgi:hypothetical protein